MADEEAKVVQGYMFGVIVMNRTGFVGLLI